MTRNENRLMQRFPSNQEFRKGKQLENFLLAREENFSVEIHFSPGQK